MQTARSSLTAIALVGILTSPCFAQGNGIEAAAQELALRIAESGRSTAAVADFTDLQGRITELGRFLAEEVSIALVNTGSGLRLIDRAHIRTLLAELELAEQGLIDPETAGELGRIAGVDVLFTGTVTELGEAARVSLKALETQTATIIAARAFDVTLSPAMTALLRRDVAATRSPSRTSDTLDRPVPSAPNVRAFQNDFLIATVNSASVSQETSGSRRGRAAIGLTFENKTANDEFLLCYRSNSSSPGRPALLDDRANTWQQREMTGISGLSFTARRNNVSASNFTRLSPGSSITVFLEFRSTGQFGPPRTVSVTMPCLRWLGGNHSNFTIGFSNIPIQGS